MKIKPMMTDEISWSLRDGFPVVALESTIIAHGMPYPDNLVTASEVEAIVRKAGAVPATIAILGGVMKIGLSAQELEHLARDGSRISKVSLCDLPYVVSFQTRHDRSASPMSGPT